MRRLNNPKVVSSISVVSKTAFQRSKVMCETVSLLRFVRVVAVVSLVILACSTTQLTAYDAVSDFSTAANPNGQWSYLGSTSNGLVPLSSTALTESATNTLQWGNGPSAPDWVGMVKNTSSSTLVYNSGNTAQPANVLYLDPQSLDADVRWTAPSAGLWAISGYFETVNRNYPGNYLPPYLEVAENSNVVWGRTTLGTTWGTTAPFSLQLALQPGDTIDFSVASENGVITQWQGTGLAAQITSVPEPATLTLLATALLGLGGFLFVRRRRVAKR